MSPSMIETRVPYYKFEFRAIVFGFKRNLYVEINNLMHRIRLSIVRTSVLLEPYLVFLTVSVRTLYCNVAMTQ